MQKTQVASRMFPALPTREDIQSPAHKPSASTSRGGSSESHGSRLVGATSSAPAAARDQGCSDSCASSKQLKSYRSRLARLKSETQSRANRTSTSPSAPRGDSEKNVLLCPVHSDSALQSNANDYSQMRSGAHKISRKSSMHSKHFWASSRSHWLAQSAEDLAAPLHSVHPDKTKRRRHSEEPDVQKLSRGSTSSNAEAALKSGMQRRGSPFLHSVRRRGSLMSTAADSNVAVSSGSAFYASQIMARRTSKPEVARAKPRPRSTDSRQSTQSNQPERSGIRVGTGQSLQSGLFSVFSALASLLGLLMSVQTYVSLVMARLLEMPRPVGNPVPVRCRLQRIRVPRSQASPHCLARVCVTKRPNPRPAMHSSSRMMTRLTKSTCKRWDPKTRKSSTILHVICNIGCQIHTCVYPGDIQTTIQRQICPTR